MHRFREQEDETLASRVAPRVRAEETVETTAEETTEQVPAARRTETGSRLLERASGRKSGACQGAEVALRPGEVDAPTEEGIARSERRGRYRAVSRGATRNARGTQERRPHTAYVRVVRGVCDPDRAFRGLSCWFRRSQDCLRASQRSERSRPGTPFLLSRLTPETILSGKYAAGLSSALTPVALFLPLSLLAGILGQRQPVARTARLRGGDRDSRYAFDDEPVFVVETRDDRQGNERRR